LGLCLWVTIILVLLFTNGHSSSGSESHAAEPGSSSLSVTLRGESEASIPFRAENGSIIEDRDVPHLVLRRNGTLTDPDERTLIVEVADIKVPPPGVTVTLAIETQHGDPDPVDKDGSVRAREPRLPFIVRRSERRIPVWREARWIANSSGVTQTGVKAVFEHTFDETVFSGTQKITMPTDYFRYEVAVVQPSRSAAAALRAAGNHAFLLENQWIAALPEVEEAAVGAAPDELIVYYADMFPFRKNVRDPASWLPREDVTEYVGSELVPRMIEAFRVQTDEWGFPWYDAWTGYRPGPDAERLSVALSDGRTWFHGIAPVRGHSAISINVAGGDNHAYDSLTDGLMSSFHHELFHSLQRNISQHSGGNGMVGGADNAWRFFSEGTAVLASSVGQPQAAPMPRTYLARANDFIGHDGSTGNLNESYREMSPYSASIYWRFLYEQCATAPDGRLDPAAGMGLVHRVLTILYSREVVDIAASIDLIQALPKIMDRALVGSPCPFDTYEESLVAFSRALYALRLEGGRCMSPGTPVGCGFYDPHNLYDAPPIETVGYSGKETAYNGEIPSSFGIDFVHTTLDQAIDGRPLTLEFRQAAGAAAQFTVQVIDTEDYGTLDLIITRVDANERSDPLGEYTIVIRPTEPTGLACSSVRPAHC